MAHQITIVSTEVVGELVRVRYREQGQPFDEIHEFPQVTLEWRCAEYDLDPANKEQLVELILAERWEEPFDPSEVITSVRGSSEDRAQITEAKKRRINKVGLAIVPKGPEWQDILTRVRAPSTMRINALRVIAANRGPEASELARLYSKGQLDEELAKGRFKGLLEQL